MFFCKSKLSCAISGLILFILLCSYWKSDDLKEKFAFSKINKNKEVHISKEEVIKRESMQDHLLNKKAKDEKLATKEFKKEDKNIKNLSASNKNEAVDKPAVAVKREYISFKVEKKEGKISLEGKFKDMDQISKIQDRLNDIGVLYVNKELRSDEKLLGYKRVDDLVNILPIFVGSFIEGDISCQNNELLVEGKVASKEDKKKIEELLSQIKNVKVKSNIEVAQRKKIDEKEKEEFTKEIKDLLTMQKIEFKTNSAQLTPKGLMVVEKVAKILKKYPDIRVEIAGFTDSRGDEKKNLILSQKRVESVKKALIKEGIDPYRLRAKGYGEANPIAPNDTPENMAKNRRVEFMIIGE